MLIKKTIILAVVILGCMVAVQASEPSVEQICKKARGQGSQEEQEKREHECLKGKIAEKECADETPGKNKRICVEQGYKRILQQASTPR